MPDASIDHHRANLETFLTNQSQSPVHIQHMKPLAGGASRESWAVDLTLNGQPQKWVVRKDTPTTMNEDALTRSQEFALMQAAYDAGVKVAPVRFLCEDESVLGHPFFLMQFVEGISIGRKVITAPELASAREKLPEYMAEELAKIHAIPLDNPALSFLQRPQENHTAAQAALNHAYSILDSLGAHIPAFEYALRWADRHAPVDEELTFIHGDFRIGNLLVDEQGLAAVIDWEFAHIGHPIEEIGYLCMRDWRFGNDHHQAAGLCDRERFIRAYERFSGRTVDRSVADWWEIVGNIRWGIICLAQAQRHLSGAEQSIELASLGRRSAEMQFEALHLIQKVGG